MACPTCYGEGGVGTLYSGVSVASKALVDACVLEHDVRELQRAIVLVQIDPLCVVYHLTVLGPGDCGEGSTIHVTHESEDAVREDV